MEALQSQARKAPIDVEIRAEHVHRYPQEVEAAAFFCALEALQNAAKHANAPRATVRLWEDDGHLAFAVQDAGVGFDPIASAAGTGIQGMTDRLAALDGELTITSSPGGGTVVTGRIPVPDGAKG